MDSQDTIQEIKERLVRMINRHWICINKIEIR